MQKTPPPSEGSAAPWAAKLMSPAMPALTPSVTTPTPPPTTLTVLPRLCINGKGSWSVWGAGRKGQLGGATAAAPSWKPLFCCSDLMDFTFVLWVFICFVAWLLLRKIMVCLLCLCFCFLFCFGRFCVFLFLILSLFCQSFPVLRLEKWWGKLCCVCNLFAFCFYSVLAHFLFYYLEFHPCFVSLSVFYLLENCSDKLYHVYIML